MRILCDFHKDFIFTPLLTPEHPVIRCWISWINPAELQVTMSCGPHTQSAESSCRRKFPCHLLTSWVVLVLLVLSSHASPTPVSIFFCSMTQQKVLHKNTIQTEHTNQYRLQRQYANSKCVQLCHIKVYMYNIVRYI